VQVTHDPYGRLDGEVPTAPGNVLEVIISP
jgi:hypothetical protein